MEHGYLMLFHLFVLKVASQQLSRETGQAMPKTSAPPLLRVLSVLLSNSASVTLYHLEISLCLFSSRRSRRCVRAPLGVDESVLMSHSLAAPGSESHHRSWAKHLCKKGAWRETVPALKEETPQPPCPWTNIAKCTGFHTVGAWV